MFLHAVQDTSSTPFESGPRLFRHIFGSPSRPATRGTPVQECRRRGGHSGAPFGIEIGNTGQPDMIIHTS